MKKKLMSLIAAVTLAATIFTGCGSSKYADVNAYLADDKVKSQLDSEMASTEDGANMEILSEKATLIYRYTFDEQLVTDDMDPEFVESSFEQALSQQDSTMQSVADSLVEYIDQDSIKVRVEYIDADGTTLCEKEYTSASK